MRDLWIVLILLLVHPHIYPNNLKTKFSACLGISEARSFKVNIFSINNGRGLEADRIILKSALELFGCEVIDKEYYNLIQDDEPRVDVNIFINTIFPQFFSCAKFNWFIPNPECYWQDPNLLENVDLILARTIEVEKIFQPLVKKIYFLGFSSYDCYRDDILKNSYSCLHLAGGSNRKGSHSVEEAWLNKEKMPPITVIGYKMFNEDMCLLQRVPTDKLRYFQNSLGIHVCPSEVEGYGHYIMEAMSAKAVVITTNAAPMNEFIQDPRCLVAYYKKFPCALGIRYFVEPEKLMEIVQNIILLSEEELREIGDKNRDVYLKKTEEFYTNLENLLIQTALELEGERGDSTGKG